MAYAKVGNSAFSFDEYERTGGLVISIPIQVGESSAEQVYQEAYGLSPKAIKSFNLMGAQAWLRAFTTPGGLFVWLPQAIMWIKAKNGNS